MTDSRYKPFQTKQMFNMICTIKGYLTRAMVFGMLLTGTYLAGIAVAPIISPRDAKAVPEWCETNACQKAPTGACYGEIDDVQVCGICLTYEVLGVPGDLTRCRAVMDNNGNMTCEQTDCEEHGRDG